MIETAQFLVCQPSSVDLGEFHNSLCPPAGAQFFQVAHRENLVLSPSAAAVFESPSTEDIGLAFSVSFSMVVGLWAASKGFGAVLSFIRAHR